MTQDLVTRLENPEDALTERKPESVKDRELRKELVAFANSVPPGQEGLIFLGVSDSGDVLGVSNPDSLQKRVRKCAEKDCYPPIQYQAYAFEQNGKTVVTIRIPESTEKPHFAGPAYIRVGSECKSATKEQYETLINSRSDKCRAIMNDQHEIFTVKAVNKRLGRVSHNVRRQTSSHECRIETCNQQYITMRDISTGERYSEPLENVEISYDQERYRPMLVVSPKWA